MPKKDSLSRADIKKIKSMIKKEIDNLKNKEIEVQIKKVIKKDYKDIDKLDDKVYDLFKDFMQNYHDMFYFRNDPNPEI